MDVQWCPDWIRIEPATWSIKSFCRGRRSKTHWPPVGILISLSATQPRQAWKCWLVSNIPKFKMQKHLFQGTRFDEHMCLVSWSRQDYCCRLCFFHMLCCLDMLPCSLNSCLEPNGENSKLLRQSTTPWPQIHSLYVILSMANILSQFLFFSPDDSHSSVRTKAPTADTMAAPVICRHCLPNLTYCNQKIHTCLLQPSNIQGTRGPHMFSRSLRLQ